MITQMDWESIRQRLRAKFGEDGAELIEEFVDMMFREHDWRDPDDGARSYD